MKERSTQDWRSKEGVNMRCSEPRSPAIDLFLVSTTQVHQFSHQLRVVEPPGQRQDDAAFSVCKHPLEIGYARLRYKAAMIGVPPGLPDGDSEPRPGGGGRFWKVVHSLPTTPRSSLGNSLWLAELPGTSGTSGNPKFLHHNLRIIKNHRLCLTNIAFSLVALGTALFMFAGLCCNLQSPMTRAGTEAILQVYQGPSLNPAGLIP
jgi:hypothetical protein